MIRQVKKKRQNMEKIGEKAAVLSFFLPVFVMLTGFVLVGIYPFGNRSFLSTDMYHQYMPFFSQFMRAVKGGEGIFYTWNVGIGTNFLALYVYYLASPFHWLGLLVPEAYYIEFLTYLVVVKIGLCGLASYCFFRERGRYLNNSMWAGCEGGRLILPEMAALFCSVFYALSGFLAAYNWNIMWLDCVWLFPLIVMGLEKLVTEGKPGLYCVTLGFSIFTNYYISIMICIFLVLYFVYLYIVRPHTVQEDTGKGKWVVHLRPLGQFALYSLLAGGMAAVLLVPEVCAILETDFGNSEFPKQVESYFSVLDILMRHCVSVNVEKGLEHWPNIYCGAAVFIMVPLYVLCDKIPVRQRFGMMALTGFMLLSFGTNILDFIWHGMNYPDSLPARQSFIYVFLILVMCYEACCSLDGNRQEEKEKLVKVVLGAALFMLFVEKFAQQEDVQDGVEWLTLLFLVFYASVMYMAYLRKGATARRILATTALLVIVLETAVNTCCTSIANVNRTAYLEYQQDYKKLYEWTGQQEEGFYRVEKWGKKTKNDGTLAGYPTASVFSSTLNSSVKDLYDRLGMRHSKVYYDHDGATAFTSALLNVNYLFAETDAYESSLYPICGSSGGVTLYKAAYTLPFGYVAPVGYDLPDGYDDSGLRLQNQMVHDLGIEKQLFVRCETERLTENVAYTAEEDGVYYGIVTASGTGKIRRMGGGEEVITYKDLKKGSILYLGSLDKGTYITLANDDDTDESPKIAVDIYRVEEEVLQQVTEILSANHLEQVTYDTTSVSGRITMEERGRLILSVPYEKGWQVTVNGEKREPQLFGESLMAFDLEPGEYELEMYYIPYGWKAGVLISVVSILGFATVMLYRKGKMSIEMKQSV